VRVAQGTGNTLQSFEAYRNDHYRVWLLGTNHNSVGGVDLLDNAIAGIYAGCWAIGPQNAQWKPAMAPSSYNIIFGGYARGGNGGEEYGVAIDLGNNNNCVISTYGSGKIQFDFLDENEGCGNNLWFAQISDRHVEPVELYTLNSAWPFGYAYCVDNLEWVMRETSSICSRRQNPARRVLVTAGGSQ